MPYNFDPTGSLPANLIADELHTLTEVNDATHRIIIPEFGPFYTNNFSLKYNDGVNGDVILQEGIDFVFCLPYLAASRSIGSMVYGGISFNYNAMNGIIKQTYQTIGGSWIADPEYVYNKLIDIAYNPRVTVWDIITNVQQTFPPVNHDQSLDYVYDYGDIILRMQAIADAITNQQPHVFDLGGGFDPDRIVITDPQGHVKTGNLTLADLTNLVNMYNNVDTRLNALEQDDNSVANSLDGINQQINNLGTALGQLTNLVGDLNNTISNQGNRLNTLDQVIDYQTNILNMLALGSGQ